MVESQKQNNPMAHRRQKNRKKKQDCIQVENRENIALDTNTNEKKTPIVFEMKFGAPFCIILLLMYFIQ